MSRGQTVVAVEAKSGRRKESLSGMESFAKQFNVKRKLLAGSQGVSIEEFLSTPVEYWLKD